jgi:23S rRNA (adenine2503-C2)-methyltransferase
MTDLDYKHNIFGLTVQELSDVLERNGESGFRGRQIAQWIYNKRVTDIRQMTNLSSPLRDRLAAKYEISRPRPRRVVRSADGTRKMLFELEDGAFESVILYDADRRTLCISSQVGCPLGCKFCATGAMGYLRNLSVAELLGQVLAANDILAPREKITNIVFMGMGETLLNYDNLVIAIGMLCSELGPSISQKKMTVSTVGLVPRILKLADSGLNVGLAISLFTADPATRRRLMPVDKKYSLPELKKAALYFAGKTGRRVTFEIVLIKDVNDSLSHAKKLVAFVHGIPCKINLIRWHPYPGSEFEKPDEENVLAFRDYLYPRTPAVTIRKSFGEDIAAACGQLATTMSPAAPDKLAR